MKSDKSAGKILRHKPESIITEENIPKESNRAEDTMRG